MERTFAIVLIFWVTLTGSIRNGEDCSKLSGDSKLLCEYVPEPIAINTANVESIGQILTIESYLLELEYLTQTFEPGLALTVNAQNVDETQNFANLINKDGSAENYTFFGGYYNWAGDINYSAGTTIDGKPYPVMVTVVYLCDSAGGSIEEAVEKKCLLVVRLLLSVDDPIPNVLGIPFFEVKIPEIANSSTEPILVPIGELFIWTIDLPIIPCYYTIENGYGWDVIIVFGNISYSQFDQFSLLKEFPNSNNPIKNTQPTQPQGNRKLYQGGPATLIPIGPSIS